MRGVLICVTVLQTADSGDWITAEFWPSTLWLRRRVLRGQSGDRGRLSRCLDHVCIHQLCSISACACVVGRGREMAACYGAARIPPRLVKAMGGSVCFYSCDCTMESYRAPMTLSGGSWPHLDNEREPGRAVWQLRSGTGVPAGSSVAWRHQ